MTIECRADRLDMTGLLLAKQGSGAAQIEILAADVEAGSKPRVLLDRLEPLYSRSRQPGLRIGQEIHDAAQPASAHSSPQLVQLCEPEPVCPPDQHGVGHGKVETAFDD